MKKVILTTLLLSVIGAGCVNSGEVSNPDRLEYKIKETEVDYDYGYEWAEENDIDNFDDCQNEFGTSDAENGCNNYVRDNYSGYQNFGDYPCTEDCSGHEAGYQWAEENDISDVDNCSGRSQSFIEGCYQYVEDNY